MPEPPNEKPGKDEKRPPPDPRSEPLQRRAAAGLKKVDWNRTGAVFAARLKYWVFTIVVKWVVIGSIYLGVVSEGLRILVPELAKKLYKLPLPFAPLLEQDEVGHRLDQAHAFAAVFLGVVLWLWPQALKYLIAPDEVEEGPWDYDRYRRMILFLSVVVIGADGCFFFYSVTQMSWGGGGVSFASVLATVAYVIVLVVVSLIGLNLKQSLINAKKEN